ncbi:MAG: DUF2341 domain-containing protein, partial [Verrucomicrobiota bacterium]
TTNGSTWSESYEAVWHLAEEDGPHIDSAGNRLRANPQGGVMQDVQGLIGGADDFDGANDWLLGPALDFTAGGAYSVSAWFNDPVPGGLQTVFSAAIGDNHGILLEINNGTFRFLHRFPLGVAGGTSIFSGSGFDDGAWHNVYAVKNGATMRLYLDGAETGSGFDASTITGPLEVVMGRPSTVNNSRYFQGTLDEFRLADTARSPDWIWASWFNVVSNQAFVCATPLADLLPEIVNDRGATNITANAATLQGDLLSDGAQPTVVSIYWGPADGGTNPAAWANSIDLGIQPEGPFAANISGLLPDILYYVRAVATNSIGVAIAPTSDVFFTGTLTVSADDPMASEAPGDPGRISIIRPPAASGIDMTVRYALSGTASSALDYAPLSGEAVMPSGATNVLIDIQPLEDLLIEPEETVILQLLPGLYRVGAMSNASVNIADNNVVTNFNQRMKVTFCGYDRNTVLTNVPLLVILDPDLSGFSYDQFNGNDLRILNSNETQFLPYEIEAWNTNDASWIWVRVPELALTGTCIHLLWGHANSNAPAYTTNGVVWSEDFGGVWHLHQEIAPGVLPDSGGGGFHGLNTGTETVTGMVADARNWNGPDRISLPPGAFAA